MDGFLPQPCPHCARVHDYRFGCANPGALAMASLPQVTAQSPAMPPVNPPKDTLSFRDHCALAAMIALMNPDVLLGMEKAFGQEPSKAPVVAQLAFHFAEAMELERQKRNVK